MQSEAPKSRGLFVETIELLQLVGSTFAEAARGAYGLARPTMKFALTITGATAGVCTFSMALWPRAFCGLFVNYYALDRWHGQVARYGGILGLYFAWSTWTARNARINLRRQAAGRALFTVLGTTLTTWYSVYGPFRDKQFDGFPFLLIGTTSLSVLLGASMALNLDIADNDYSF